MTPQERREQLLAEKAAIENRYKPEPEKKKPDVSMAESVVAGVGQGFTGGNADKYLASKAIYGEFGGAAPVVALLDERGLLPEWAGGGRAEIGKLAEQGFAQELDDAREANRNAYLAGEIGGFLIPGAAGLKVGGAAARAAGKTLISPGIRSLAYPTGSGALSKVGRYTQGVVLPTAAAGALDYGGFKATVEAGDKENETGQDVSLAERGKMFVEGATDPWALAGGAAMSPAFRVARGAATGAKAKATGGKFTDATLTPKPRRQQVEATLAGADYDRLRRLGYGHDEIIKADPNELMPRARHRALKMVHKRLKQQGMTTDDIRQAVKELSYGNYSSVDEMLFELAGASNDQLAVALANVGGDAAETARKRLTKRSSEAPQRLSGSLSKAMGVEGGDFYKVRDTLRQRRRTEPGQGYKDAYGKTVSQDTWETQIFPVLNESPSAKRAIDEAADYAADTGELVVARELGEFSARLDAGETGSPLSTQALDYIDRMLGDMAEGIRRGSGRQELARGPAGAQSRIRGSGDRGLDPETGLDQPRSLVAELKTAEEALEFGRKAFNKGTDVETLVGEYADQIGRYGNENIGMALLQGWVRGAEDKLATATNPGTVLRQLYGSQRQREKLIALLPENPSLSSGRKSDQTKRFRQLVGDKYKAGTEGRRGMGRIDRESRMFDNQQRLIRGSQTAPRSEAIAEQGGTQDKIGRFVETVLGGPREALRKVALAGTNRATRPGIYDPEINTALGDIMFTSGKDDLLRVLDDVDRIGNSGRGSGGGPIKTAGFSGVSRRLQNSEQALNQSGRTAERGNESFFDERLSPSQNKAVEMYRNGYTRAEIADEMDITRNHLKSLFSRARSRGVDVEKSRGGNVVSDQTERAFELRAQGLTNQQIAERLGMSPNNVAVAVTKAKARGELPKDFGFSSALGVPVARSLQAIERRFTPASSPKHYAETLRASGAQGAQPGRPAIEQMSNPRPAASELADAAAREQQRGGRVRPQGAEAMVETYRRQIRPEAASQAARAKKNDRLYEALTEARAERSAALEAYRSAGRGQKRAAAERLRQATNDVLRAENSMARPPQVIDQSGQAVPEGVESEIAQILDQEFGQRTVANMTPDEPYRMKPIPQRLGSALADPMTISPAGRQAPASAPQRRGRIGTWGPGRLEPVNRRGRRSVDDRMAQLTLNPEYAGEAAEVARSGARFNTYEKTGTAIVTGLGAAGIGTTLSLGDGRDSMRDRVETRMDFGLDAPIEEDARNYTPSYPRGVQTKLAKLGYMADFEADGDWGERSAAALAEFQADHGLPGNGKMNRTTQELLDKMVFGELEPVN